MSRVGPPSGIIPFTDRGIVDGLTVPCDRSCIHQDVGSSKRVQDLLGQVLGTLGISGIALDREGSSSMKALLI